MSFISEWYQIFQKIGSADIPRLLQFIQSDFLYKQDLLEFFLWERDFAQLPRTRFIDYSRFLRYHADELSQVHLWHDDSQRSILLPYHELINFTTDPDTRIWVEGDVQPYVMPNDLLELTEASLHAFRGHKKDVFPGPLLRLARLVSSGDQFSCRLEHTNYFMQARTNLTLDYPIPGAGPIAADFLAEPTDGTDPITLRSLDATNGFRLRSFDESLLANTIGIAGLVYFRRMEDNYIFMKLRKEELGVFERMFGSVSGNGQYIQNLIVPELVSYAQREIIREFNKETGLQDTASFIKRVVPLAFTRELIRGGKPQFFFVIEIPDLSESSVRTQFKKSASGLQEFYDDVVANKTSFRQTLSPEFAMNLIYALQFFQQERSMPIDLVRLYF